MIHYNAAQISDIALTRLNQLAEHYSSESSPVKFDKPLVHAGSLLMVSTMYCQGKLGSIQVPIPAGIFDPQIFEQHIDAKVEEVYNLIDAEVAA